MLAMAPVPTIIILPPVKVGSLSTATMSVFLVIPFVNSAGEVPPLSVWTASRPTMSLRKATASHTARAINFIILIPVYAKTVQQIADNVQGPTAINA